MTTSSLRARIAQVARATEQTPHSFIRSQRERDYKLCEPPQLKTTLDNRRR